LRYEYTVSTNASHTFGRPPAYRQDHKLRKIVGRHVTTLAGGSEEGAADRAGPAGASIWLALDEIRHCSLGARSELAAKSCPLKDYADWRCNKKVPEFFPKTLAAPMLFGRTSGARKRSGQSQMFTETASKFDNLMLMKVA